MIIEQILVTQMAVFCYLVADEVSHEGILIDPAGDFDRIFRQVDKYGVNVKWVLNTHGHPDHTSGNGEVMKRTGAPLLIHEDDLKYLGGITVDRYERYNPEKSENMPVQYLQDNA